MVSPVILYTPFVIFVVDSLAKGVVPEPVVIFPAIATVFPVTLRVAVKLNGTPTVYVLLSVVPFK